MQVIEAQCFLVWRLTITSNTSRWMRSRGRAVRWFASVSTARGFEDPQAEQPEHGYQPGHRGAPVPAGAPGAA
jgi:hypothetical protein